MGLINPDGKKLTQKGLGLYDMRWPFCRKILDETDLNSIKPYLIPGKGNTKEIGLLLIHGFSSTLSIFTDLVNRLSVDGFTISVPCLPGHGAHPEDLLTVNRQDWLQTVENAFDFLNQQCKQVIVIGFSLGGALAIHLACKHPNIKKLILIAPAICLKWYLRLLCTTLSLITKLGIRFLPMLAGDIKKPDTYEIAYNKVPTHALGQLYLLTKHVQKILPELKTERIVFYSHYDHIVDSRLSTKMLINCGLNEEKLIWLDNSYHVLLLDNDAEVIINTILREMSIQRTG